MERPILFSAPMVRAILEGRKTQTRRVPTRGNTFRDGIRASSERWNELDLQSPEIFVDDGPSPAGNPGPYLHVPDKDGDCSHRIYPQWRRGDRLWVREAWGIAGDMPHDPGYVEYRADCTGNFNDVGDLIPRWRPSIHMPRKYSRILLEITDVRVQRVQDISEEDARAEGVLWVPGHGEITAADLHEGYSNYLNCREGFQVLWDSLNEKRGFGWNANPWTWALTFKRVTESAR